MRGTTLVPPWYHFWYHRWYQGGTTWKNDHFSIFSKVDLHFDPLFLGQNKGSNKGSKHVRGTTLVPPWYHFWYHRWYLGGTTWKNDIFNFFQGRLHFDPLFLGQNKGSNKGSIRGQNTCVVPPWYHTWYQKWYQGGTSVVPHGEMTTFQFFPTASCSAMHNLL